MLTLDKPLFLPITGQRSSTLITYEIVFNGATMYTGKAMTDANGRADVRVDGVLRDFRPNLAVEWSQTRLTVPDLYDSSVVHLIPALRGITWTPVELWAGGGRMAKINVFGGSFSPWEVPPQQEIAVGNLATMGGLSVIPRIPMAPLKEAYFGVAFYNEKGSFELSQGGTSKTYECKAGVVSFQSRIGEITFDREPGEILMSIDGGTKFPVMIVEECPAPYYLQWRMPSMGLASWPFEGNVRMGAGLSPMEIRTGEDEQRIVSAEGRAVYDLNSGYVTREEWNYLQTMQYAKEVLLVDVARGVTIPCTVTSATWQTAGNVRHGQHNFPVQLTEKHYTTI